MNRCFTAAALIVTAAIAPMPAMAQLSIGVSIRVAPPLLPIYAQPPLPGPDYLWAPGYWAWDDYTDAYFWVPGTWVRAPRPGLLWTPPWWGWSDGLYVFHSGYWGQHIGFYGGVPYGFGYTGFGYQGGYWNGGHVFYNRSVTNVTNVNVTNVYQRTVIVNQSPRIAYNGGPGGIQARPRPEEQLAARDAHVAPTGDQRAHLAAAHGDPRAFASANHGRPPLAATPRPLAGPGGPRLAAARTIGGNPAAQMGRPPSHGAPPGSPTDPQRPDLRGAADLHAHPQTAVARQNFGRSDPVDRDPAPGGLRAEAAPRPATNHPPHQAPPPHPRPAPHPAPHPHAQAHAPHPHPPAHHDDGHRE